jgi:RNA polymerase sigma factor for flagellar operon FliA
MSAQSTLQAPRRDTTLELWREYRATGDTALRDRLILTFAPLVKSIVFKKLRQLPAHCELEDFISCGLEALMQSIDRYDPDKGATLEQFLWTRIHGAVLDELRRQDWAPRSLRRWERDIAFARNHFFVLHNRQPTPQEVAESVGCTANELSRIEFNIAASDVTSLNTLLQGADDANNAERLDGLISHDSSTDPEHVTASQDACHKLREAVAGLSAREREVAVLLYANELKLREVGEIMGVSESRVCQIHKTLKRKLRRSLATETALFLEAA